MNQKLYSVDIRKIFIAIPLVIIFLSNILLRPEFIKGIINTNFINQFKSSPEVKETITNVERRYLNSSMVIESGMWHRKGVLDPTSPTVGRYSCTLIKQNDKWQIIHDRAWSLPDKDSNGYYHIDYNLFSFV